MTSERTKTRRSAADQKKLHPHLILETHDAIEILRIDRQEALGALNDEIIDALYDYASGLANRQQAVRVVIVTGTGRSFVAGADIKGYHQASQSDFDNFQRRSRRAFDALARTAQITCCAVNGYALGGGLELALCCDFIFVSDTAKLGLPEIKLGLLPGGGGTQRLPRLIGPMRTKDLVLTGRMMAAQEAVACGLALQTFAPADLMPGVLDIAQTLAAQAPLALMHGKQVIDDGLETSLTAGLTLEQRALAGLFATDDGKEGIAAFVAKRDPRFQGR
ncbi:MAG: enoyl-CoA hydratase-related protein [Pseudomonadota bacterium]